MKTRDGYISINHPLMDNDRSYMRCWDDGKMFCYFASPNKRKNYMGLNLNLTCHDIKFNCLNLEMAEIWLEEFYDKEEAKQILTMIKNVFVKWRGI
jgi:hypothetical protein